MSEKMTLIPFEKLLLWMETEYKNSESVFGVSKAYTATDKSIPIFGEKMETPMGPAAGPNTQLSQNIIAAYFAGARFFELKTVQIMDGEELAACISRPCILANHEGYNCEWSTELTVPQAFEEYVKAWCAIKYFARAWKLGNPDGFVFNMSVGYDLAGVKSEKLDRFIEGLKNAENTEVFRACIASLCEKYPEDAAYIRAISPRICKSATLSTLHGCPPDEIERIASYLIAEKGLHTFVKCNPTILGYASARRILDSMGYDYIAFDEHHFNEDLQFSDAVPMFRRLTALASEHALTFGLKLSNTFPVDVKQNELPSEEMYMSGRSLFPLTIEMAKRFTHEFGGKMPISFAGGADAFNVEALFDAGIFPITVATTILKPGGYNRLSQMAKLLEKKQFSAFSLVSESKLDEIIAGLSKDAHHLNPIKPIPSRKIAESLPLLDCFAPPCADGCPIQQDIPEYMELYRRGEMTAALRVILAKNPLPFITGTICAQRCANKCTRNFYDSAVGIRSAKLACAEHGFAELLAEIKPIGKRDEIKVAIVGGGPSGMAAAHFLAKYGAKVTIFEKNDALGGIVRQVIPSFRIEDEAIEKDAKLLSALGVQIKLGTAAPKTAAELFALGYTHVYYAVGATKPGALAVSGNVIPALSFLRSVKSGEALSLGKNVVIVGGGNTAMDTARAAKRQAGVSHVSILYRRTKRFMPADAQELCEAMEDGVEFIELASPVSQENGELLCCKMKLGEPDESGRRSPLATDEQFSVPCDTLILAVGEQVDAEFFENAGVSLHAGRAPKNAGGNIFCGGDCARGPATVVEAIADAKSFAESVLGFEITAEIPQNALSPISEIRAKKGELTEGGCEGERCLSCRQLCERCVEVCPNRANVAITLPDGRSQIVHIERMCNECGNCETFCVYEGRPYKDKITLFHTLSEFEESESVGFIFLDDTRLRLRFNGTHDCDLGSDTIPSELSETIKAIKTNYGYIL